MNDWKNCVVSASTSLETAIAILDKAGFRIVLVVDERNRLLGTVTDGDIRRALLKNIGLDGGVEKVMNRKPQTTYQDEPRYSILERMRRSELIHMPVVDSKGVLLGLEMLPNLVASEANQNPILLMAGGFGKRMRPLTDACPKPMLKVAGRPILELIIDKFASSGFREIYISLHFLGEVISDYFGDGSDWGVNITYLTEEKPLGTAGALSLLPEELSTQPIVVMNGDVLTNVDLLRLTEFHREMGGTATMCVQQYELEVPYGIVESTEAGVIDIVEKPTQRFFVNAGVYVLNHEVLRLVEKETRLDMPELLKKLIDDGQTVSQFPIHEYWIDIGLKTQFEKAQNDASTVS